MSQFFNPVLDESKDFIEQVKKNETIDENTKIIGRWLYGRGIYTITSKNGEHFIGSRFPDGSGSERAITAISIGNEITFAVPEGGIFANDVTVLKISPSGDLILIGEDGVLDTLQNIK